MDSNFLAVKTGSPSIFARTSGNDKSMKKLLLEPQNSRNPKKAVDNSLLSSTSQSIDQDHQLQFSKLKSEDKNGKRLARKASLEINDDLTNYMPSRNNISHSNIDNLMDSKHLKGHDFNLQSQKSRNTNSTFSNAEIPRIPSNSKTSYTPSDRNKSKSKLSEIVKPAPKFMHIDEMTLTNIYSSTNSSSMIYIPENYLKVAPSNRQLLFTSFNDLTRKEKIADMDLLDKIIQAENSHQFLHYDQKPELNKVGLLTQKLEFNKHQKDIYKKTMEEKLRTTFLPLISHEKEANDKLARMPKIRTYPSKRMMIQNMTSNQHLDNKQDDQPEIVDLQSQKAEIGQTISANENLTYSYQFFWYFQEKDNSNWKPSGREGCTLTTVGRHVVLYGGLSNVENDEIVVYDPVKRMWAKPKMSGEMPFYGRHGHSALEYKKSVIFFGGEKKYNESISLRECLNDTRSYNPEKNEWKFFKCIGKVIEPRRSHSSAIHDRMMYIYGGISSHGRYLNDIWGLNLSNIIHFYCLLN